MSMQTKAGDRWRRIGVSFVSAMGAEVIIGVLIASIDGEHLLFEHIFGFLYFASILVVPGWLIALPIILQPKFDSLRIWKRILIGTLIGPVIILGIGIYGAIADGARFSSYSPEAYHFLYVAIGVSFLASAIYVAVLGRLSKGTEFAADYDR